jgi:hypothetical protein
MGNGFRKLPSSLLGQIEAATKTGFVFGARLRGGGERLRSTAERLSLEGDAQSAFGIPQSSVGRWSRWNRVGFSRARKDLPKVEKSFTRERPNFGDPSKGYHATSWTMMVWQRDELYGQQIPASIALRDPDEDDVIALVEKRFPAGGTFNDDELLYAASLSREWFGVATVIPLGEAGEPTFEDAPLAWEILPVGVTGPDLVSFLRSRLGPRASDGDIAFAADRLERVASLDPTDRLIGTSEFARYLGFKFGPDFVAFENATPGNALYVMRENWEELSQLPRTELLATRRGEFTRIVHSAKWHDRLSGLVYEYRQQ